MSRIPIAIVDYGAGNLRSVEKALEHLGHKPIITSSPKDVQNAPVVVFPGQGIAGPCMQNLENSGLLEALKGRATENKPLFGVCLGLQLLLSWTEEGDQDCLDIIEGKTSASPKKQRSPTWVGIQLPKQPSIRCLRMLITRRNFISSIAITPYLTMIRL